VEGRKGGERRGGRQRQRQGVTRGSGVEGKMTKNSWRRESKVHEEQTISNQARMYEKQPTAKTQWLKMIEIVLEETRHQDEKPQMECTNDKTIKH